MTYRRRIVEDLSQYGLGIVRTVARQAVTVNGDAIGYPELRAILYEKDPIKFECMRSDYIKFKMDFYQAEAAKVPILEERIRELEEEVNTLNAATTDLSFQQMRGE